MARFSFSRWLGILIKEFIQLRRDRLTFGMIVGIPIIQLMLFGFAINSDPRHMPTAVIAGETSEFTRSVIAGMRNSEYFDVVAELPDEEAGRDALDFLVNAFLADSTDSPVRYCSKGRKGDDLVRRVRASRAEGVLLCAPSFCDPALLDQPLLQDELDRAGIPWTNFKYAENTGQFQVIREQAGTFADSIKLWSDA